MIPAHKHLVQWGLDRGFTIEVNCEGETDYYGTDYDEAIEAIEATEHGSILLVDSSTKNEPINYHASFTMSLTTTKSQTKSSTIVVLIK